MSAEQAAERDIVRKLARGSLLSRLTGKARQPLRLIGVPRDHVQGDRQRGEALLAGKFIAGGDMLALADLDFAAVGTTGAIAEQLQGFSWLRDLAAAATREKGSRLAEAIAGRWLIAHGSRVDDAWRPELWGERILFWTAYAPYILSSQDAGYRSALLNTMARGSRHLEGNADKAPPGLKRITAWAGLVAAGLVVQGGIARIARSEAGLGRALGSGQYDDGGLISRTPYEQALLVDRLGLLRAAYAAAKQALPEGIEAASAAALSALQGVAMGDGALSSWQGGNPGDRGAAGGADRRLRDAGAAAAPAARLGISPAVGAGHDRGDRLRAAAAGEDGAVGRRVDAGVRIVRRVAAPDRQLRRPRRAKRRDAGRSDRGAAQHRRAQHPDRRRRQLDRDPR